jgi:hypothetical protein
MRDNSEQRLRDLRNGIGEVIEILQSVRQRTQGFARKHVEAEKASLETQSKFDQLKARLAKKISKLADTEDGLVAHRQEHDEVYLKWFAVNKKLALLGYFRRLRDSSCIQTARSSSGLLARADEVIE